MDNYFMDRDQGSRLGVIPQLFLLIPDIISASLFQWFLICRAMVGVGEASYSTIAPTIISDMFVKVL